MVDIGACICFAAYYVTQQVLLSGLVTCDSGRNSVCIRGTRGLEICWVSHVDLEASDRVGLLIVANSACTTSLLTWYLRLISVLRKYCRGRATTFGEVMEL